MQGGCLQASAGKRRKTHVVFCGDLGATYAPILPAPKSPYRADVLVLDSPLATEITRAYRDLRPFWDA